MLELKPIGLTWLSAIDRPTSPKRIPSVLTRAEVAAVLAGLTPDTARLEGGLKSQVKAVRCQWEVDRQAHRSGVGSACPGGQVPRGGTASLLDALLPH